MKRKYLIGSLIIMSFLVIGGILVNNFFLTDSQVLGSKARTVDGEPHEIGGFKYSSSIDNIDNLYARYEFIKNKKKLPVVILMHGYIEEVGDIDEEVYTRLAKQGVFVCAVGMRGRDEAGGKKDASARELYDIYDALTYIKANFPDVIDPNNVSLVGYSGGGANALGMAVKFPDAFDNVISHFGISDYGYDSQEGWYQQNTYPLDRIEDYIGGTPAEVKDAYYARAHVLGLQNYRNGYFYFFSDKEDEAVPVSQTENAIKKLKEQSLNNYYVNITDENDKIRWLHSLPQPDQPVINTEDIWLTDVIDKKHENTGIDTKGQIKVMGYIITDEFEIWLGDGTEEVADVTYDISLKTFEITPLTDTMTVTVKLGNDKITKTIDKKTNLIVN